MAQAPLNLVIVGQVDHGKSTLIGRLLFETGSLTEAVIQALEQAAKKRGSEMEWAFAIDSLQIERTQGITLDTTRTWLKRPDRDIVLIDAPGHHELLRNMLTGATSADAALILVDATEGLTPQTRKHAELLRLLGISQCAIIINKMDAVDFDAKAYTRLSEECAEALTFKQAVVIPISARQGDNIVSPSARMPWYKGPSLLATIDAFAPRAAEKTAPLRLCVQDVVRVGSERIITGKIASGRLSIGDPLYFSPTGSVSKLKAFKAWPETEMIKRSAEAGESVGLILETQVFCERGDVISYEHPPPLWLSRIPATLVWLNTEALRPGDAYTLQIGTQEIVAEVQQVEVGTLAQHQIGQVLLKLRGMAVSDHASECPDLSRFVLLNRQRQVCAAGFVDALHAQDERASRAEHKSDHISPYHQPISTMMFEDRNGHKGGIFWFSGLSGAGKSTLARELQKILFARGKQVVILDGDNMRGGLSRDLGFSAADRRENIRRAAEVAKLFADSGLIVLTAFITPTEADRELARMAAPDKLYHIYLKADLALCETRDIKGLYKLARAGKIPEFTGISAPFEEPQAADFTVDTSAPLPECIDQLLHYIEQRTALETQWNRPSYMA